MRTDRLAWSQVACDNLKKAGATDEIFYYRRVLGKRSMQLMCLLHNTLHKSN